MSNNQRPFGLVALFFAIGIWLGSLVPIVAVGLVLFASSFSLAIGTSYLGRSHARLPFWLMIVAAGYVLVVLSQPVLPWDGSTRTMRGQVLEVRSLTHYQRLLVRIEDAPLTVAVHWPEDVPVQRYSMVAVTGPVVIPPFAGNENEFCYRSFLANKGVYGVIVRPDQVQVLCLEGTPGFLARLQARIAANLDRADPDTGILQALILGRRDRLDETWSDRWQRLGIGHLLAISGMHIGLVAAVTAVVMQRLSISFSVGRLLLYLILLLYVLVSGGRPSAWRALLVCVLAAGPLMAQQRSDTLHAIELAAVIMLAASPQLLFDIGFQLSFAAVTGIVLWNPILARNCRVLPWWLRKVTHCLAISMVAQLSLVPLLGHYFGSLVLTSPLATLVVAPFIVVILGCGFLVGLFGALAFPFVWIGQATIALLQWGTELLLPWAWQITVPRPSLPFAIGWYVVWFGTAHRFAPPPLFPRRQSLRRIVVCGVVLLLLAFVVSWLQPLQVTVIDVGQGDAILVQTPTGKTILIDGGGDSPYWQQRGRNVGRDRLLPYLNYLGVTAIDKVFLSHPHEDHLFGLLEVLERIPVAKMLTNGQPHTTSSFHRFLTVVSEENIPHRVVQAGEQLSLTGGVKLDVVHPCQLLVGTSCDLNNNSLVLLLSFRKRHFLFTGDIDRAGQMDLLSRVDLPACDWLKVPHHGSESALHLPFLEQVQPNYAVISVGPNSFGHPSPRVIDALDQLGARVYRTDMDGAVSFFVWPLPFGRGFLTRRRIF